VDEVDVEDEDVVDWEQPKSEPTIAIANADRNRLIKLFAQM
jgi:hypothetical protein